MSHNIDYSTASAELILQDIGDRLARIRLSRNISQAVLAQRSGVTRRTLSRLETGQGATLDTWVRVMRGLNLQSHLEALLPDPGIQPMQRMDSGKERQRARTSAESSTELWTWGEDEPS